MRFQQYLNELFDKPPKIDIDFWAGNMGATVDLIDTGTRIIMQFGKYADKAYKTDFSMKDKGSANPMQIFMGAMTAIKQFTKKVKADELAFLPASMSRSKIYKRMIEKFMDKSWEVTVRSDLPFMRGIPSFFIKKKGKKGFDFEKFD